MKIFIPAFALALLVMLCTSAQADNLTADQQHALQQTQEMLNNPTLRNQAIAGDPKAQAAAAKVTEISKGDPKKEAEMYSIASSIMAGVAQKGADENQVNNTLSAAAANPEAFFNSLTPEQKARIQALAGQK